MQAELDAADKLIAIKLTELNDTNDKILSSETELADKKQAISDSEEKLYSVTAEVEKTDTKLLQEREKVNTLLQYMPDIEKKQNAEHEYLVIISELHDMMKSGISILKKKTLSSAMLIDLKALYVKHWINGTKLIFPYMLYASVATSLLMNVIRLMKK